MKKILLFTLCMALFSCTNEPVPVKVESVELSQNELTLTVDESTQLKAIVLPKNAENKSLYWSSSKSEVAIAEDGLVTAIAPGTTTVTVITDDGGKKATCVVTVVPKPVLVTGVTLNEENVRLFLGHEVTLTARVVPSDATNTNLIWKTSDEHVATVTGGIVKAVGCGSAVITVMTVDGGFKAECVVKVTKECQTQVKGPMTLDLGRVTATTAVLSGFLDVDQLAGYDVAGGGVGFIYAPSGTELDIDNAEKVSILSVDSDNAFSKTLTGLKYNTRYNYTIFLHRNGIVQYGETQCFDTKVVAISVDQVSLNSTNATLKGNVVRLPEDSDVKVGLMCSSSNKFPSGSTEYTITPSDDGSYTKKITGLTVGTTYYYRTYLYYGGKYEYGATKEFTTNAINVTLSVSSKTATTVTFSGKMDPVSEKSNVTIGVYVNTSETVNSANYERKVNVVNSDIAADGSFTITVSGLSIYTQYFYTPFVYSTKYTYGEIKDFTTNNIVATLSAKSSDITATTAKITGTITGMADADKSEIDAIGIAYSTSSSSLKTSSSAKERASITANTFTVTLEPLTHNCKYYYCYYVKQDGGYTYGETKELTTKNVTPSVSLVASSLTATKANIIGTVPSLSSTDRARLEFGVAYSTTSSSLKTSTSSKTSSTLSSDGAYSVSLENLNFNTKYYYCSYVKQNGSYTYGETKEFNTVNVCPSVNVVESSITATNATILGIVSNLFDSDKPCLEFGVAYSTSSSSLMSSSSAKKSLILSSDGTYSVSLENLNINTKYYYCSYVKQNDNYTYGEVKQFTTTSPSAPAGYINLSATGTANCYIISQSGSYCLLVAKGNQSLNLLYLTNSASVLWESFGTSTIPNEGDLIKSVSYKDGYIAFKTADTFTEGNAVIAAKAANGKILWSWHIWLTDQPQGQVYYNNAGTMMDRNLGATSATPGDVGALGLLYQWGRKDPFLGSSSISSGTPAKSTITWPYSVSSDSSTGTIAYATANPTTFIGRNSSNSSNYDWYYTGSSSTDNTRWTASESNKSIYDPCPAGWRIPDGGDEGVWNKALGGLTSLGDYEYDTSKQGCDFSGILGPDSSIWYPETGYISYNYGLESSGYIGSCWSATSYPTVTGPASYYKNDAVTLQIENGKVHGQWAPEHRVNGLSVRCVQESK